MTKQGVLEFDNYEKRYIVVYDDGKSFNRALHCGDVIEVLNGSTWIPTRIEYNDCWYLDSKNIKIKCGLIVRTA